MRAVAGEVVWSVVRGDSRNSRAVEPGIAGVAIPTTCSTGRRGTGLSIDQPDVYLLVTPPTKQAK
jgi:hypothetical protein